ncbi:unnamed protein product [Ostreobium quekettii]|uniref:Uncharacterized protein n=1 Tax=Ostreobium quekettii TaxID=121088 RepID=A0A8S1IMB5_9CHLO|nr:unnamed protein product [Ostreobium quekettii]
MCVHHGPLPAGLGAVPYCFAAPQGRPHVRSMRTSVSSGLLVSLYCKYLSTTATEPWEGLKESRKTLIPCRSCAGQECACILIGFRGPPGAGPLASGVVHQGLLRWRNPDVGLLFELRPPIVGTQVTRTAVAVVSIG